MRRAKISKMGPGDFVRLATRCGLDLTELDLAQMARRKLIVPCDGVDGEPYYTELHLYVLAQYMRTVRPIRHPWATKGAEVSLDQVSSLAEEVNRFIARAFSSAGDGPSGQDREFMVAMERFLARIDPFGPVGGFFEMLQAQVIQEIQNSGRLYLEVKQAVSELSALLRGEATWKVEAEDDPRTQKMFDVDESAVEERDGSGDFRSTAVISADEVDASLEADTARETRDAIDEVVSAASEASAISEASGDPETSANSEASGNPEANGNPVANDISEPEEGSPDSFSSAEEIAGEADDDLFQNAAEETQIIEVAAAEEEQLAEETSEPIVLLDAPVEEDAEEEQTPDEGDEESSTDSPDASAPSPPAPPEEDVEKAVAAGPPPSPVERIAELNRRREVYMKEQSWDELAQLYEDGIGLFTEPAERQKVFLTLGTVYEVKLREKSKAFGAFSRAWKEGANTDGGKKALKGIERLGKESEVHQLYLKWLQEQLSGSLEPEVEVRLQKELALGLFSDQEYEQAFSVYASFLEEKPNQNVTLDRLNQLQLFGEHVDDQKLEQCLERLREAELSPKVQRLIEEFAPAIGG